MDGERERKNKRGREERNWRGRRFIQLPPPPPSLTPAIPRWLQIKRCMPEFTYITINQY